MLAAGDSGFLEPVSEWGAGLAGPGAVRRPPALLSPAPALQRAVAGRGRRLGVGGRGPLRDGSWGGGAVGAPAKQRRAPEGAGVGAGNAAERPGEVGSALR